MKIAFILILFLIRSSSTTDCSINCIGCLKTGCIGCIESKKVNSFECSKTENPIKNCFLHYSQANNLCYWCKVGYVEKNGECKKLENLIEGCINHKFSEQRGVFCETCAGGYPSKDQKHCNRFEEYENQHVFRNCLWGGLFHKIQPICMRCQTGYSILDFLCERSEIEGCWIMKSNEKEKICNVCDPWLGYHSLEVGKCQIKNADMYDL